MDWEFAFLNWIQTNLKCAFLDTVMPLITKLGDAGIFWIAVTLLMLAVRRTRKYGHAAAFALSFGLVIGNCLLKPLIARVRPYDIQTAVSLLISAPTDFSFPSGHTQASFAVATVIFLWNKRVGTVALITAALVAFSRMYLYVHYPTDVLAGLLFGVTFALVGNLSANRLFRGKKEWDGCRLA